MKICSKMIYSGSDQAKIGNLLNEEMPFFPFQIGETLTRQSRSYRRAALHDYIYIMNIIIYYKDDYKHQVYV